MKNYLHPGETLTLTPADDVASGGVLVFGGLVAVAVNATAADQPGEFKTTGVFALTKKAGEAIAAGDLVYWDEDPGEITKTPADGMYLAGVATVAALAGDVTVAVRLNGIAAAAVDVP